jgi:hypothetical protein
LLNDASQVAPILSGGTLSYEFALLEQGSYFVYTYAVDVAGGVTATPVTVQNASPVIEVVTGPMPGNALEHLITHSIHSIAIGTGESLVVSVTQPPSLSSEMYVNGFQIVMVPEPSPALAISFGLLAMLASRKSKRRRKHEEATCNILHPGSSQFM